MNSGQARARLVQVGVAFLAAALIAGCGDAYRPVVTPVGTSGPAAQTTSYAVVVSAPSDTATGIATIIDYSGDTVMAQANIGPGPYSFSIDTLGSTGYTINHDGTLSNFPISTSLQSKLVTYTTLPASAEPLNLLVPSSGMWATDLNGNVADVFSGSPQTFKLAVPVAPTPVAMAGAPSLTGQREYVLSENFSDPDGTACNISPTTQPDGMVTPIEISTNSPDTPIQVGKCPVFAVQSPDLKRLFVLNRGSDTISVVDTQKNVLDNECPKSSGGCVNLDGQTYYTHPVLPLSTAALTADNAPANCDITTNPTCGLPSTAGPVYAEYMPTTQQLVVANYDGSTVNVIDVSLDIYGNDSSTFGTTYTIPVGKNPASVTALYDGSRAYTANQTDGTVSIVNLSSHTLEKTLQVVGHPRTVVSTQNSLYGKVYVDSPDSPYLTIVNAETDLVDTTLLIQGVTSNVDVRVTTQNGSSGSGNANYTSRIPGYGQPCNLPPDMMVAKYGANYTAKECRSIP